MKNRYLFSVIPIILGIRCVVVYRIIGSEIVPDGTLIEPFFLIPIGWFFILAGAVAGLIATAQTT